MFHPLNEISSQKKMDATTSKSTAEQTTQHLTVGRRKRGSRGDVQDKPASARSPARSKQRSSYSSSSSTAASRSPSTSSSSTTLTSSDQQFVALRPKELVQPQNMLFTGTGKWRRYAEPLQVIAKSEDGTSLLMQHPDDVQSLYIISPTDWANKDATRAIRLSLDEAKRKLDFFQQENDIQRQRLEEELKALAVSQQKQLREQKKEVKEKYVNDTLLHRKMYIDSVSESNIQEIKESILVRLEKASACGYQLVDAMVQHLALSNTAASRWPGIDVIHWNGRRQQQDPSNFKGVFPFDVKHCLDGSTDTDQRDAYVFQTPDGKLYRVLPENLQSNIVKDFHILPRSTVSSSGSATRSRSSSSSTSTKTTLDMPWVATTIKQLKKSQQKGQFNRLSLEEGIKNNTAAAAMGGIDTLIQFNRHHQKQLKIEIKKNLEQFMQHILKEKEKEQDRRIEIEEAVLVHIVEEKLKDFLESTSIRSRENILDDLVEDAKRMAPTIWRTFSKLGRVRDGRLRDGRNTKMTPAKKERNILKAILTTIKGSNEKLLYYFGIFMAFVKLYKKVSYASLDELASEGQCASSKEVIDFFKAHQKDYSIFTYGDKIKILWDNINLYIRKKFGSSQDASQSKLSHTTVFIILENTSVAVKDTTATKPTYDSMRDYINSNPYDLATTLSGNIVPADMKFYYLLPHSVRDDSSDELMMVKETSLARFEVGVVNWMLDQLSLLRQMILGEHKSVSASQHEEMCVKLNLNETTLKQVERFVSSYQLEHSVSAREYAGEHPDKETVRQNPVVKFDSGVVPVNEMSIDGTVYLLRLLFGRTSMGLSFNDVYDLLTGKSPIKMTIMISGDRGTMALLDSVLMRAVLGMKSKDFKIAVFCAQVYIMVVSSFHRGDPLHEYHIHGAQSLFKLFFPNGLQAVTIAISSKSVSPERAKGSCQRHLEVLEQCARGRFLLVLIELITSNVLQETVVGSGSGTYIDPERFVEVVGAHLSDGGESFQQQGSEFVTHVAALSAARQAMRHLDTSMCDAYTKFSIALHKLLGKKYGSGLASEIEARHFWSPYAEHVYQIETLVHALGSQSTGGTCLGNTIEQAVGMAKQRETPYHQNLYLSNSQVVHDSHLAMHGVQDGVATRLHHHAPKHFLQLARIMEVYKKSGVATPQDGTSAEEGVASMHRVADVFVKQDKKDLEEKKRASDASESSSSSSSSSSKSGALAGGEHSSEEEKTIRLKMKDMGKTNGDDEVWGNTIPIPEPPKVVFPFVNRFIGYREKFSSAQESKFANSRKKLHRTRLYLINDSIQCFIANHCQDLEAAAAGTTIKIDIADSDLPDIDVAMLSTEEQEWYTHVMEEFKADASFEEQEFVGGVVGE